MNASIEPHHIWIPEPGEVRRVAAAAVFLVVSRLPWLIMTAFCVLYVVVSVAVGRGDAAHYAILLVPVALPALVFGVAWWGLRRLLVPGFRWTSTFGPESVTFTTPLGRSELLYSRMRRVRRRGPFVVIHLAPAGRITTYGALVPISAEQYLQAQIGVRR